MSHVAASDCERCRSGPVAQPVNTASSLAYVAAGLVVLRGEAAATGHRRGPTPRSALGWAAVAAGLGSVAYHGPGTALGRYVHDASLLALLATMAVDDLESVAGREAAPAVLAAVPPLAALAAHPRTSAVAQASVGAVSAVVGAARGVRSGGARSWVGLGVLGLGALAHVLGRTGGPLCRPDALVQPHAAWHVATAVSLVLRPR